MRKKNLKICCWTVYDIQNRFKNDFVKKKLETLIIEIGRTQNELLMITYGDNKIQERYRVTLCEIIYVVIL